MIENFALCVLWNLCARDLKVKVKFLKKWLASLFFELLRSQIEFAEESISQMIDLRLL